MILNTFNGYNISLFAFFLLSTFFICLIKLHLDLGPGIIIRLMVTPPLVLNAIFLVIFTFIFYFIWDSLDYEHIFSYMTDKDNTNINLGQNATINVNDGRVNLQVNHMNRVAAAVSATGGATAGIQVAKYVAGPPAVKVAAGVATAVGVQATTAIMSKVLNQSNNGSSKLVANLIASSNGGNILNDYPLNLLSDVNTLLICALVFLYIIINIYISKYIINKNWVKYIPQNRQIGKIFVFWLNKYLDLWSKSSNYLLGFCYFMLFFFIGVCKFALYIILSY